MGDYELLERLKDAIVRLPGKRLVDCIDELRDILAEIDRLAERAGIEDRCGRDAEADYGHDEAMADIAHMDDVASGTQAFRLVAYIAHLEAAEERARVAEAERDFERRVAAELAERLTYAGWCRPDGQRSTAPCQEDGDTCSECAYDAAREAVERSDHE